jgi:hypothetical protein
VEELAKSVKHEQRPAIYNETRGNFYFYNFGQNQQASPPENSAAFMLEKKEDKFWEDAKLLGNKEALEAYLKQYPRGRYAALANAYLIRLQSSASSLTSQPISNPLSSGMAIPSSQNPSSPNSGGDADCDRLSETSTISSNMAKDNNRNPANVVVTSSHARTKNHNVQTPINCNRDK